MRVHLHVCVKILAYIHKFAYTYADDFFFLIFKVLELYHFNRRYF